MGLVVQLAQRLGLERVWVSLKWELCRGDGVGGGTVHSRVERVAENGWT